MLQDAFISVSFNMVFTMRSRKMYGMGTTGAGSTATPSLPTNVAPPIITPTAVPSRGRPRTLAEVAADRDAGVNTIPADTLTGSSTGRNPKNRAEDPQYSPKTISADAGNSPSTPLSLDGASAESNHGADPTPAATVVGSSVLLDHSVDPMPAKYLVFINKFSKFFPAVEKTETYEVEIQVPGTFRARTGPPPVRMLTEPGETDRQTLMNELHRHNVSFFEMKMRNCSWCKKPAKEFYPHFKAMYQFDSTPKNRTSGEMNSFRPMCHLIPICGEDCLNSLQGWYYSSRVKPSPVFDTSFERIFGKYHEFRHSARTTRRAIIEMAIGDNQTTLNWCGICRDHWCVMLQVIMCEANKVKQELQE
jgi:hypothetical protein